MTAKHPKSGKSSSGLGLTTPWLTTLWATELSKTSEVLQVTTLLTVIGEEAHKVFSTFSNWAKEGNNSKIAPVLAKFEQYCQPRKNVSFEHYRFNQCVQEPGETYDQYRTALRKLAEGCDFGLITPNQMLRNQLVFGIRDAKVRERLLREADLTLKKTDEICHAAESMMAQVKIVDGQQRPLKAVRECWNCGRRHDFSKRELCPAFGKTCNKCHKPNHFANKCRSKWADTAVRAIKDDEVYQTHMPGAHLDDSQLVTLRLESGHYMCFQVDTGVQCNVVPLEMYKKATKDYMLKHVLPTKQKITAYGGATIPVIGQVLL